MTAGQILDINSASDLSVVFQERNASNLHDLARKCFGKGLSGMHLKLKFVTDKDRIRITSFKRIVVLVSSIGEVGNVG
jgi:hypothetical protein